MRASHANTQRSTTDLARSMATRLGLPAAAALMLAASSPAIAHAVPRFLFPTVALVGAGLMTVAFSRASWAVVRGPRADRSRAIGRFALTSIGFVILTLLPLTRLVGILTAPAAAPPRILVGFGDWRGGEGYPRSSPHRGLDFAGRVGSDVLAAADGRVVVAHEHGDLCGLIVVIVHAPHDYRTVYCHFATIGVRPGDDVARGQPIGTVGTTGQRAWPGYEHVHLELQRGRDVAAVEDPRPRLAGCFDAQARYPTDRLVLTYPLRCRV
jgi:murein DD-endopeptidase MepM/ murein hydrolase activator NlpD